MFKRTLMLRFLPLLGALVALPACDPSPFLLLNLIGIPAEAFRIPVVVYQSGKSGVVTFQREKLTNKWLPMESMTPPPSGPAPMTTSVAIELPRGTDGDVTLGVTVEPLGAEVMGMMTAMPAPLAGACLHFTLHDAALTETQVPLLATPPPCP